MEAKGTYRVSPTPPEEERPGRGASALAIAAGTTAMAILPMFLVSGLFVLMGPELGFGERALGLSVGAFYGVSALVSPYAGIVSDRLGPRRALQLGVGLGVICSVAMAAASSLTWLVVFLLGAGVATAVNQMASNVLLVSATPRHRQALAFAVKQSVVPGASLLGGAALPLIGLTIGWRWAFALPVLLALVLLIPIPVAEPVQGRRKEDGQPVNVVALVILAVGAAAAIAAANAAAAFLVPYAVSVGASVSAAGGLLAFGGATGVISRLIAGWSVDRYTPDGLTVSAVFVAVGVLGFLLILAAPRGILLGVAVAIIFGAGWGWSGIFTHAVARSYPEAAGRSTGVTQAGIFTGGMLGPAIFGVIVSSAGYTPAWLVTVLLAMLGGGLIALGRSRLRGTQVVA